LLSRAQLHLHPSCADGRSKSAALKQIEAYAQRYRFFHFEVAFPEAFSGDKKALTSS